MVFEQIVVELLIDSAVLADDFVSHFAKELRVRGFVWLVVLLFLAVIGELGDPFTRIIHFLIEDSIHQVAQLGSEVKDSVWWQEDDMIMVETNDDHEQVEDPIGDTDLCKDVHFGAVEQEDFDGEHAHPDKERQIEDSLVEHSRYHCRVVR